MRSCKWIAGAAMAAGMLLAPAALSARTVDKNTSLTQSDIQRDRRQLHYDLKHGHFIRAKHDRAQLRRDERAMRDMSR